MLGLEKKEIIWVLVIWLLVICVTGAVYYNAVRIAPAGQVFTGNFAPLGDFNAHYSFIRQAADGQWLFRNINTPEPHQADYFHLEYLVIGKTASLFRLSLETAFHLWRVLGSLALLWAFALALKLYFEDLRSRIWALAFFAFSGGLGWLVYLVQSLRGTLGLMPLDMVAEIHPFNQMFFTPHSTWANALNILGVYWFIRGVRAGESHSFALAGFFIFLSGCFRPFGLIFFGLFVGLWAVGEYFRKRLTVKSVTNYATALFLPTVILGYNVYIFRFHPVFRWWSIQNKVASPDLLTAALFFGLPLVFALAAVVRRGFSGPLTVTEQLLYLWAALSLLLVFSDFLFSFAYQFSTLTMPPLYLLMALVIFPGSKIRAYPKPLLTRLPKTWRQNTLLAGLLVIFSLTNALTLSIINKRTLGGQAYLSKQWLEASRWVESNTPPEARFIASYYRANYLTRYTGRVVFVGYNYSTVDFANKMSMLAKFLSWKSARFNRELLQTWGIDYIWDGPRERLFRGAPIEAPYLKKVYHNNEVEIYKFEG